MSLGDVARLVGLQKGLAAPDRFGSFNSAMLAHDAGPLPWSPLTAAPIAGPLVPKHEQKFTRLTLHVVVQHVEDGSGSRSEWGGFHGW